MGNKIKPDIAPASIKPLIFNPEELDLSKLRKLLPEHLVLTVSNIAAIAGIPKRVLDAGRWHSPSSLQLPEQPKHRA